MRTTALSHDLPVGLCFAIAGHLAVLVVGLFWDLFSQQMPTGSRGETGILVSLVQMAADPQVEDQALAGPAKIQESREREAGADPAPLASPARIRVEKQQKNNSNRPAGSERVMQVGADPLAGHRAAGGERDRVAAAGAVSSATVPAAHVPAISKAKPRYQENPVPEYPQLARRRGWQGRVVLEVTIMADGSVEQVRLHTGSSYTLLDKAAVATVKQWLFSPERHDGRPVQAKVLVPVQFSLN